jgi:hypothetical protein
VPLDVRLLTVMALLVLIVCLAVGFARMAFAIRRDYEARFRRIRQQLEQNATSLVAGLLRQNDGAEERPKPD